MAELNFGTSSSHACELPAGSSLRDWQAVGKIQWDILGVLKRYVSNIDEDIAYVWETHGIYSHNLYSIPIQYDLGLGVFENDRFSPQMGMFVRNS